MQEFIERPHGSNGSSGDSSDFCGYTEKTTLFRYFYITAFGCIACTGIFSNLLLFCIFTTKRKQSNVAPNLYQAVLALLDTALCVLFLLVFVVDVQMLYWENYELFVVYHSYIVPVFGLAKLVQFLIPYVLILATYERYTWITKSSQRFYCFRPQGTTFSLFITVIFAFAIRGAALFANEVAEFVCPDPLRTLAVVPKEWAKDGNFQTVDNILIAVLQTFFPFLILSVLNVVIVKKLYEYEKSKRKPVEIDDIPVLQKGTRTRGILLKHRSLKLLHSISLTRLTSDVRKAVFTMVAIVSAYMVCNVPHVILAILELSNNPILYSSEDKMLASEFYTALADTVSILYMLSSCIRILIYIKCNKTIRRQVLQWTRSTPLIPQSTLV